MVASPIPARWAGPDAHWRQALVAGTRIRWVEAGAGPPLIMLHGYGGSARWWQRNIRPLGAIRRVYALDLPGFGGSRLVREPFAFDRIAALLAEWLASGGLAPADVLAHSMGGQLALILAAGHPEWVRRLVLAAPAGIPFETGLPGIAISAWRSRRAGDWRFTPIVVGGSLRAGPVVMWQAVQQIRSVDVRRYLARIAAPTLIVWGDRDGLLPARNGPLLAGAIAGARLVVVEGGGHNLMWDRARLFNELAAEFLTVEEGARATS